MAESSDDVLLTGGNEIRAYYALDEAMMTAHREKENEKAIATARSLLEHPQLPLQLRARACMVLGCSDEPDFLDMAKEAVRVAELALSRCTEPVGDVETQLVADCHTVLKEAQEAHDELEHEEGELVWQAEDDVPGNPGTAKQ